MVVNHIHVYKTCVLPLCILSKVVRQDEPLLICAINELARGIVSENTIGFLQSLNGHLPDNPSKKRVLFSTNDAVDIHNSRQLHSLPGKLYSFLSKDEGLKVDLGKLQVPKVYIQTLHYVHTFSNKL